MQDKLKRRLLFTAGTIFTGTGILGIFVPILPTTPFLLLAAACYVRSSQRFYNWLMNNRLFGTYISNYIQGKGMPLRVKVFTVSLLWITIGLSTWLVTQSIVIRVILVLVAVGVTTHIILIKNYEKRKVRRFSLVISRRDNGSKKGTFFRSGLLRVLVLRLNRRGRRG